eukprot:2215421-Amphidinium_carterae.1
MLDGSIDAVADLVAGGSTPPEKVAASASVDVQLGQQRQQQVPLQSNGRDEHEADCLMMGVDVPVGLFSSDDEK